MILTKTQLKIMQLFTAKAIELFTIRQVERELNIDYSLVHRAITPLIKEHTLLILNKQGRLSLNIRNSHDTLAYVEYLRRNEFLKNTKNRYLAMCLKEFIKKFKEESFVLAVFGSAVNKDNPRDIDILLIVDQAEKIESAEKQLYNISRNYELDKLFHIVCISFESVYEMLSKREERNVMNEVLNKHLIIYGAELFYRLIERGRK